MEKLNLDLNYYSFSDLCDMFDIDVTKKFDKTVLNQSYNSMLTSVKAEVNIPGPKKDDILNFLDKAFKKMLEQDSDYKLTEGNFMPNLEKTEIFSREKPIIKKTYNEKVTSLINPFKMEKTVKILNINTLFRKNYYNQESTDFIIDLPETLKNVTSLTLMNSEIPNTMYTFSSKLGTNEFTIETYQKEEAASPPWKILKKKKHVIRIKDGNYTATELCDYLNKYVFSPDAIAELKRVCCHYDKNSKKIIFLRDTRDASIGGEADDETVGAGVKLYFNIDWRLSENANRSIQLNMGWILGYRKAYYSTEDGDYVTKTQVSFDKHEGFEPEACFQNSQGQRYIFLSIDDFNKNYSKTLLSPFEDSVINDNNIFAKINNTSDTFNYTNGDEVWFKRCYFGPVDIMKLRIKLLDEFGRTIDLNKSDYSFTLKIEQLYNMNAN